MEAVNFKPLNSGNKNVFKMDNIEVRRKRLEEQAMATAAELTRIAEEEAIAAIQKVESDKARKAELLDAAEGYEAASKEPGLTKDDVDNRRRWAKQARTDAAKIFVDIRPLEEVQKQVFELGWLDKNRNLFTAFMSLLLIVVFYLAMNLIKVEDPEAIVYDSSAFQKVFLVLSIFSALQLVKIMAVRLFYPLIYHFKNNREMPDFDFSQYFKEELSPLQQICVSLFISSFYSLEFIMLLQVKF